MSSNYPEGAEFDMSAPYNEPLDKDIEVTISMTLSKTVTISVPDDGTDIEDLPLQEIVREQIMLPNDAFKMCRKEFSREDLTDWDIDEFEVIPE